MGRAVLTVLGIVAEMELGFIRDRKKGKSATEIAKAVGCKCGNVYKRSRRRGLNDGR